MPAMFTYPVKGSKKAHGMPSTSVLKKVRKNNKKPKIKAHMDIQAIGFSSFV